ncbi:permease-like cell division protein FtsX [Jatrophihabitans sp. DSM 45814]
MSGVATGLRRNVSMTVALVLSTGISLAFLGGAFLLSKEISKFEDLYKDKINVSVYLCTDISKDSAGSPCKSKVTDVQRAAVQAKLSSDPAVKSFEYITEAAATQRAKELLGAATVDEAGPGSFPASFLLKLNDLKKDYPLIEQKYATQPGVDVVQNQDQSLKIVLNLFDSARWAARILALIVGVCAIIQMTNTIQVAAAQRRNETGIMRLVGASRLMTQLPFIIEAVIAALAGGVIALILDWFGKVYILDHVFHDQVQANVLPGLNGNDIIVAGGVGIIAGVVLAALTAWATLRLAVRL